MFRTISWPFVAALSLISVPMLADEPAPAADAVANAATVPGSVQVFIDEETGEVRAPTEAETAAMAEQFRRRYIDLSVEKPVVYHEDGSISKELGSRHRMYTVARISEDGALENVCLPAEQAADFLAGGEKEKPGAETGVEEDAQ